jgi:hypothetical protein
VRFSKNGTNNNVTHKFGHIVRKIRSVDFLSALEK